MLMENTKQKWTLSRLLHMRLSVKTIASALFVLYFANDVMLSLFARTVMSGPIVLFAYNTSFLFLVVLHLLWAKKKNIFRSIVVYSIIFLLFLFTYIFHPEYEPWFFEKTYGIQIQFFRMTGGIWAFLVVSLVDDPKRIHKNLRIACLMEFVFLCFRFLTVQRRGYWINYDSQYNQVEGAYNLGFGYDMLFLVVFFSAEAFLFNRKKYYIPFAIGTLLILFGGSRGAIVWVFVGFVLMLPYKWKQMTKRERTITILVLIFLLPFVILLYIYQDELMMFLTAAFSRSGMTSRTIESFLSGDITSANGRDIIAEITIERIKEGGLFGNGVFGERLAVGRRARWGYAHNIFLEIYAAFGYLGGTVASVLLVGAIIKAGMLCKTMDEKVIYVTFLVSSFKLFFSDSFWFNASFWGLLAFICIIFQNHKRRGKRISPLNQHQRLLINRGKQ